MAQTPASPPFARELSNAPYCEYWTCPGCYADLHRKDGHRAETTVPCPDCGRQVELSIEMQPVYVAALPEAEESDDE